MSTHSEPPIAANPAKGQEVFDLDRAHVFHSWSAQSLISPLPIATGRVDRKSVV